MSATSRRLSAPAVAALAWVHQTTELGQRALCRTHATTFASLRRQGLIEGPAGTPTLTEDGRQALHASRTLRWI